MARILNVFLEQELVGRLKQSDAGYMNFRYDPAWLQHPNRIRLSISLPLQPETFRYKDCRGFFSGLLPEAEVRKITASNFGISHENDFSLLEKIGGECAGAVTFLPPGQAPDISHPIYQPLSKNELTDMIKNLPQRPLLAGQKKVRLSLAGAQPKIAVHIQDDRISLPLNGAPSTHLLKPEHPRFQNLVWNEAFCMQLARTVGIAVPKVEVKYSDQTVYLLIKRYDRERMPNSDRLKRLHQEDFCQALGISPEFKYQREGGLSLKKCFELVERYSDIPAV
ncbi:type II toxin-antitoxin system HipA family toxin, partial [bacterium]|nr:type II toxin-antitoxin system HipA family toxin [bacterium]